MKSLGPFIILKIDLGKNAKKIQNMGLCAFQKNVPPQQKNVPTKARRMAADLHTWLVTRAPAVCKSNNCKRWGQSNNDGQREGIQQHADMQKK